MTKEDYLDEASQAHGFNGWIHAGFLEEPAQLTTVVKFAMDLYAQSELSEAKNALQEAIKSYEKLLREANKDIEGLHKEVLAYREKVSEQLKEIERLREQNETLKAGINQCHADYTDQQQEIERLKELLSGMCNNPYYTEKYIEAWDKAKSLITPK